MYAHLLSQLISRSLRGIRALRRISNRALEKRYVTRDVLYQKEGRRGEEKEKLCGISEMSLIIHEPPSGV